MITRTNFLDLLGGNSRKYHSCIITSYTFDILFFEQTVLPRLRRAGIQNINIYVDAHMFQKQLENFQGKEYLSRNRDYSITPVFLKGAFHSKSLLAVGNAKGLLAIGSGNITGSGLSNNEEIWSAFHYKDNENLTDGIFSKSIKYLDSLQSHTFGTNSRKIKWISENSNWYKDLLNRDAEPGGLEENQTRINIFATSADSSFFQNVIRHIPKEPEKIKILSPYYNRSGRFILELLDFLKPKKIHCIVDPDYGNIPIELNKNQSIEFSDWSELKPESSKLKKSLHAKAFQFEYNDRTIFLLGSANATTEAFGTENMMAENAEMLVKIESESKKDFFKELGIDIPIQGTLDLSEVKNKITPPEGFHEGWPVTIFHSEFQNYMLQIIIEESSFKKFIIRIENGDSQVLGEKEVEVSGNEVEVKIDDIIQEEIFRCSLWKDEKRISNYGYPQNVSALNGTNPDERLARWNEIRTHDIFDGLGIEVFLDFLNEDQFFDKKSSPTLNNKKTEDEEEIPEPVSTEEFNKNASIEENYKLGQSHLTSLIEDFLSHLVFGQEEQIEVSDNVEQAAIGNIEEAGDDKEVIHRETNFTFAEGLRIRKKLEKVLSRIIDYIQDATSILYSRFNVQENDHHLKMDHLNAQLIGLSLILKYLNKTFDQRTIQITIGYKDRDKLNFLEKKYSLERHSRQKGNPDGVVSYDLDVNFTEKILDEIEKDKSFRLVKLNKEKEKEIRHFFFNSSWLSDVCSDYLILCLGSFLYTLNKGEISGDDKDAIKIRHQMEKILEYSILIIYNFNWKKKGLIWRDLFLLNILNSYENDIPIDKIISRLNSIVESSGKNLKFDDENIAHLKKLVSRYKNFMKKVHLNSGSIKEELSPRLEKQIIYSSNYGFAQLNDARTNKQIDIISPLGPFIKNKGIYGFGDIFIGKNIRVFRG